MWKTIPVAASFDWKISAADSYESFVASVAAMMTMNEVVDCWNRQHVGSNQIGSEERDRVNIDKQARLTWNRCTPETAASGGVGV